MYTYDVLLSLPGNPLPLALCRCLTPQIACTVLQALESGGCDYPVAVVRQRRPDPPAPDNPFPGEVT